jgi:hypothetical protein
MRNIIENSGFVETLSVEKERKYLGQEGVSPPPCLTPDKIFCGQGSMVESLKYFRGL